MQNHLRVPRALGDDIVDDIVVDSKTIEGYDRNFSALLNRLQETNPIFKKDTCKIGMSETVFMPLNTHAWDQQKRRF